MNRLNTLGMWDIAGLALLIILAMVASVALYRGMQRPRLRLTHDSERGWVARPRDIVQYVVAIPFLVTGWVLWLTVILLIAVNDLDGSRMLEVACAVVLATRVLAHLSHEHANQLAKSVPLTLVTLVLISGSLRDPGAIATALDQLTKTSLTRPAMVLIVGADLIITLIWYWVGVRWWADRGGRGIPGRLAPEHSIPQAESPS